jgi:hypothetical protein
MAMNRVPRVLRLIVLVGLALNLAVLTRAQPPTHTEDLILAYSLEQLSDGAISGGVPKDGIPAIDNPQFQSAREADSFLKPDDVVFGVVINGEAKAYPRRILVWHEIANDRLGGENISVTYCPLTGTAIGFKRGDTTFGVSGDLVNSNLIMYDRKTQSRWPQMVGTATSGPLKGQSLERFRVLWSSWKDWRALHPGTLVLSRRTGFARDYFRDPYGGSYNPPTGYYATGKPTFPTLNSDSRLKPKTIITGARTAQGSIAFSKSSLRSAYVVDAALDTETVLTAFYDGRLDTVYVYHNPQQRNFRYARGRFSDGSGSWHASDVPLEPVHAYDAMWFAWSAFFPQTQVYD